MMLPRLLAVVLLTGCHLIGPRPALAQQAGEAFSAVVDADSAIFRITTPASVWDRILSVPDTARAGRGSVIWIVWWDTIPRAVPRPACCGLDVEIRLDSTRAATPGDLLATASRRSVRADRRDGTVVLTPEPSLTAIWEAGILTLRLGPSFSLSELGRMRPDSIRLDANLWAADLRYVAWARPRYLK